MITMTWYKKNIKTMEDLMEMIRHYKKTKPKYTSFDTETDGLHHITSKPFLIAFGYLDLKKKEGYSYTFDFELRKKLTKPFMTAFIGLFDKAEKVMAHNTKFDLHMLHNIGYPELFHHNITDTMIFIRLAHNAVAQRHGGVTLKLKPYAKEYIDHNALRHEQELKDEMAQLIRKNNRKLKEMLKNEPLPEEFKVSGKEKSWTIGIINHFLDDNITDEKDLPKGVREKFRRWKKETRNTTRYNDLNREKLTEYAHYDIIYTMEAFLKTYEVALNRGQQETIKREEKLIHPLYRLERIGFKFNTEYALSAKESLRKYIMQRRKDFKTMAGRDITVNQDKEIKKVLKTKYNLNLNKTGKQILEQYKEGKVKKFIEAILEIRTLEKWYSTYILKWTENIVNGRVYTTIKQMGAVSGRVSSDFQQFPDKPIVDKDGNTLFIPRKMIQVSDAPYDRMLLIDYSQIELRIQAMYTWFISGGDKNLCRAYIPFECVNSKGETFNPENKTHKHHWDTEEWYLKENPKQKWEPIDLHTATTLNIFPKKTEDTPGFKKLRKIGKMTNFACNYGATPKALASQLNNDMSMGQKAYDAYLKTFPKVQEYRQYIKAIIDRQGYVENLFGRKYYTTSSHNAQNYVIQGSAADFLKQKIIEIDDFLRKHNYKSRMQMNIHDEISFELHRDDPKDLPYKLKAIMEQLSDAPIPIIGDIEYTDTTWNEKRDWA